MNDIDQVVEFMIDSGTYPEEDFENLYRAVQAHLIYKTIQIVYDKDREVCAVARWNVSVDGKTAYVIDLIIREDYQRSGMLEGILENGLSMFPTLEWIEYQRQEKYPERGNRRLKIKEILNGRKERGNNDTDHPADASTGTLDG